MSWVEFKDIKEFQEKIKSLKQEKFTMYVTSKQEVIVRPKSRSSYDSFIMRNLTSEQILWIKNIWSGEKFNVENIFISDERDFRQYSQ